MTLFTRLALAVAFTTTFSHPAQSQALRGPDTVVVRNGSLELRALLWLPVGRGPFPAVLFNHGSGPATQPERPATLGPVFARHGYAVLYLFRRGAGLSSSQGVNSAALMSKAFAERGQAGRNEMQLELLDRELGDVRAGLDFLRGHREVDGRRIAVAGHSFGGQLSLLLAERDSTLRVAVVFGAAAGSWEGSPKLRARLVAAVDRTVVPVMFVHAANDYSVEPGKVLAAEMAKLGKAQQLKIYPAVGRTPDEGHDFVHSRVSMWEPDVFAFLDEHTKRPPK